MPFSGRAPAGQHTESKLRTARSSCMDAMRPHLVWRGLWLAMPAFLAAGMIFFGTALPTVAGETADLVDASADSPVAATECHLHYPFVVNILDPLHKTHMCTGVLIQSHIVLSTASCLRLIEAGEDLPYTRPGSCNLNKYDGPEGNEEVIRVQEKIVHEEYTGQPQGGSNFALLVLKDKMKKHTPIHRTTSIQGCTSANLSTVGWFANPIDDSPSPFLYVAWSLSHIAPDKCEETLDKMKNPLPKDAICAITPPSSNRAWDEGAPLLCYDHNGDPSLVGLGTFDGALPGKKTYSPYVYTHISEMKGWIDKNIKTFVDKTEL
ncbi:unnamed protein product [Ostreobium quekettii]|uniref:Peptidase S1 domain-containing protein n=1 Tax=Ostreobium quekettii TaxID=121088 RepID=A0A8S1J7M0_9CHLO|nr:unnamed protein product [Ostreobium quekettii]